VVAQPATVDVVPAAIVPVVDGERMLLYFENEVLRRFNLATQPLHVDLEKISTDDVLQGAMTAIAKAHFSYYGRSNTSPEPKRARLNALKAFRESLVTQNCSLDSAQSLFITNVLFCVLDGIIDPDEENLAMQAHFMGGKAMLKNWTALVDQLESNKKGMQPLGLSIFATMDLVQCLLSGQEPYFGGDWYLERGETDAWWGCLETGNPYLEIMAILSKLGHLGHKVYRQGETVPIGELFEIQRALESNSERQSSPTFSDDSMGSEQEDYDRSWFAFCTAYRQSALIYMYRVLCNLEPTHSLVQQAVHEGARAVSGKPLTGNLAHCLLFPTLIVGSHSFDPEEQRKLRKSLHETAHFLSFGGIQLMDSFLQERWKLNQTNFTWWDCFKEIATKTSLF
jgi:hypothetical protein